MSDKSEHWNAVYQKRPASEVSWFQSEPRISLELIEACDCGREVAVLDVGAGASTLVDGLLARGFSDITLLDVADAAFASTRQRLPQAHIEYLVSDITAWTPGRSYDIWHDRAVFHFLVDERDRIAYRAALRAAVPVGGHVIIGTFAADGPERCSGLPVRRYSASALSEEFQGLLKSVETRSERHVTPGGSEQSFVFVRFTRV